MKKLPGSPPRFKFSAIFAMLLATALSLEYLLLMLFTPFSYARDVKWVAGGTLVAWIVNALSIYFIVRYGIAYAVWLMFPEQQ